jgi:hypothetical protein
MQLLHQGVLIRYVHVVAHTGHTFLSLLWTGFKLGALSDTLFCVSLLASIDGGHFATCSKVS